MSAERFNNFKDALGDGKTRLIFIGGLVVVIAITMFAIWSYSSKKANSRGGFPASEVPQLPSVQTGIQDGQLKGATPVYDKLIQEQNEREAQKAKENGGSALPIMRTGVEKPIPQPVPQAQQPVPTQDTHRDDEQRRQQAITARTQAMKNQVNLLVTAWSSKEHAQVFVGTKELQRADPTTANQSAVTTGVASTTSTTRVPTKKAGDSCYAELDTAINTDEPSPVIATIMQCGELDQAKLVGKVEVPQNAQYSQKAVLHFTTINIPGQPNSLPTDAYAMDEETRRTALASDVDNHYLLRYGSLFASAFMSGFGDALLKGGQNQQLVTTATGAIVQQEAYDTKQMVLAGFGNVGKQAGSNMGSVFNRPATIKVNSKIGIGIVFMTDLALK